MDTLALIQQQITNHPILLYMKGTPTFPSCGFSAQAVQVLKTLGYPFTTVNILEHPDIRATLPGFAQWPTFPQLWVLGELVGGCDIMLEMARSQELQPLLAAAIESQESSH
ncbi:MAG: Grx4 family monothiol glutaredoxin [Candidatus Symbiodolus clandestinus]